MQTWHAQNKTPRTHQEGCIVSQPSSQTPILYPPSNSKDAKMSPAIAKFAVIALLVLQPLAAAKAELYRWTDDEGNVHYTDRVPPQYIEQGYRVMSQQGMTVETVKPKEEEEEEIQKSLLKKELEEKIKQDKLLLDNYLSEDEILNVRDRKIQEVKAALALRKESIRSLENEFRDHTRQASDYEKKGQPIPQELREQMDTTERKIASYQKAIEEQQNKLSEINAYYDDELKRYREIKKIVKQREELGSSPPQK